MAPRKTVAQTAADTPGTIPTVAIRDRKVQAAIREGRALEDQIAALKAQLDDKKDLIKALMGDAEIGTVGGVAVVSYRQSVVWSLDQSKLKAEHPEIAQKCLVSKGRRTFKFLGEAS